jgi:hypothetical protein
MRVRLKPSIAARFPSGFRRVGIVIGPEWQDVNTTQLSPEKLNHLTGDSSRRWLDIEGAPAGKSPPPGTPVEAVVAAKKADVSLPGSPTVAEAAAVTAREEGTEEHRRRGRRRTEE